MQISDTPASVFLTAAVRRPTDLSGTLGDDRLDASSGVAVEMVAVI